MSRFPPLERFFPFIPAYSTSVPVVAAIEMLLKEYCELPAFSTLDRMARRIRTLVNGGIYQTILARLTEEQQHVFARLLEQEPSTPVTALFSLMNCPLDESQNSFHNQNLKRSGS